MRYRVRPGHQAIRNGVVIARAGEIVEVDIDIDADRAWVDDQFEVLEPLRETPGWVERREESDYMDRSMRARRRSPR